MNLHELLRKIPKAELHVHLTGTVFPKTLQKLSRKHAVKLPPHDRIEDLYDRSEFKSILPMLKTAVSVMQDSEDFALVVYETMREAAENGVRYREILEPDRSSGHSWSRLQNDCGQYHRRIARS